MEIDLGTENINTYLAMIKLCLGVLGSICAVLIVVVGWIIVATRWSTKVDLGLKAIQDSSPVSELKCLSHREHFSSEFGHGEARFKRIEEQIDAKDVEDEARYQGLLKILLEVAKR